MSGEFVEELKEEVISDALSTQEVFLNRKLTEEISDQQIYDHSKKPIDTNLAKQISQLSGLSMEEKIPHEYLLKTARSESMNIFDGMNDLRSSGNFNFIDGPLPRNLRSGSLYIPPKVHDKVLEKSEKIVKIDSSLFLKNRGVIRHMI